MSRILKQGLINLAIYNEWLRGGSKECCRCPREQDSLAGFAPPGTAVLEKPKSRELFCGQCGRPRSYLELIDFTPSSSFKP